ncbi:MAG TPA: DNA polymerase III subunit delta' [Rhodospirillaceae bacterium]|nr:DNA polymerase III subunit delta' [Rhodospirillaceae bacterium]|tara:strand:- start:2707 stop:3171 length:465 start_codon:yes stop_codon:yes gene_type:complete
MLEIKRLSLDDARLLIRGATKRANAIKVPMVIAVVDESGHLIAFERMDGGKILSTSLAFDKATTAAVSRKGTHDYNAAALPGQLTFGIQTALGGRFSIVGGGRPVVVGSDVVGGIGVSGGAPEQDMDVAQAGIDHFLKTRVARKKPVPAKKRRA